MGGGLLSDKYVEAEPKKGLFGEHCWLGGHLCLQAGVEILFLLRALLELLLALFSAARLQPGCLCIALRPTGSSLLSASMMDEGQTHTFARSPIWLIFCWCWSHFHSQTTLGHRQDFQLAPAYIFGTEACFSSRQ